jgi:3-hydroxyisobutyrate dehydrogenase-like beta-hydroxyacid dehydrogenase
MAAATVGLLHPGEMGAAVGAVLRGRGDRVVWASEGRTVETWERAEEAGLEDAGSVEELVRRSDVILSVCPPHAALEVAGAVAGFRGVFVDANAIAPGTAREVEAVIAAGGGDCVDGGIVGAPPRAAGTTRFYLSGPEAESVAGLFTESVVDARVLSGEVGTASALKMTYAAWTKGTAALLLAIGELARAEGVEPALHEEWRISLPDLPDRSQRAARSAQAKGWRWVGEMEEIAATFDAAGLPDGFHRAAAEVFRTLSAGRQAR